MSTRATRNFKKRKAAQKETQSKHSANVKPGIVTIDIEANGLNSPMGTAPEPKGQKGGRCNVTACQRPGAVFQNVGMISTGGSWYCRSCATDIHNANTRDKMREHPAEFTLFPAFQEVADRYLQLRRSDKDQHDIENYSDIEQNPWGSCYHFARDKWLDEQLVQMEGL